jgi:transcriptional regulator with XRE-family HTH domain
MENLAKNLKLARISRGWTLKDAQNHTGINIVTIGSYERGHRLPPINMIQRLANHYGTTIAWLVGEECKQCNIVSNALHTQVIELKEAINGITLRN